MKKVKEALAAYLEDSYFRPVSVEKKHGIDVSGVEAGFEDLRNLLEAIPDYIEIEDEQYEAIVRWIDADFGHIGSPYQYARQTEISILTYINSCYASRRR